MKTSEETKAIFPAMVVASKGIKNLYPGAKGYGYQYVPLEAVIDHLRDVLPSIGLTYVQMPTGGDRETIGLCTRIIHESGEWIESEATFPLTDMKGVNRSQAAGAALTYFRRYALCAAFGITGDADIDMHGDEAKYVAAIDKINAVQSVDELKEIWPGIVKEYGAVPSIVSAKDKRKEELS